MSEDVTIKKIASPEKTRLNVIFIHGLGGDPIKTWLYEVLVIKSHAPYLYHPPSKYDIPGLPI